MGLTNAERQRRWRLKHPAESVRHLQQLRHHGRRADQVRGNGDGLESGNDISGSNEAAREVKGSGAFTVERILRKRRTSDGNTETLVKFKGLPNEYNRWLTEAEMQQYHVKSRGK